MRRDVATDLEHDLGPAPEPQRARVASAPDAVHVDGDRPAERSESARAERLAPDAEEMTQRRSALIVDDAARVERPSMSAAVRAHHAAQTETRPLEPDGRRDDDDAAPREQFDVNARYRR